MAKYFVGGVCAAVSLLLCTAAGEAFASPIVTYDTSVISWDVGSGQSNNHFAVTSDDDFVGGALQLGLRAEQRSVGGVAPAPGTADYLVQTGADPTKSDRAWWNFHLAINYAGGITNLSSLSLEIDRFAGTNGDGGLFDLLALYPALDDQNVFSSDSFLLDQNPVFGWFTPSYDLSSTDDFAYGFYLTAIVDNDAGNSFVTAQMCVHTAGASCTVADVPEPSGTALTATLLAILLAAFGLYRWRQSGSRVN